MSGNRPSPSVKPSSYGSARDLPSYQEMAQLIKGGKLLTLFIARNQRAKLIEIENKLKQLTDVVDRFYERLGPRNWIFHDSMNVSGVEEILNDTTDPETAERRLIELYRDADGMNLWLMRLRGIDGLRERSHQIERAREHYDAARFDSCTLHLIAVMDGFVNDFEPEVRKGLATRDPDDMSAWNSVVGHHMGLTHALKTFTKTIKKRVDQEVFEVFRHGIMHGSIVSFDNAVVATKAWNMLFAVADWAQATTKSREPEPAKPSFGATLQQLSDNRKMREQIDAWRPANLGVGDDGFDDHEIYQLTHAFLRAWADGNFGALAEFPSRLFAGGERKGQLAGEMRDHFKGFTLTDFEISQLENSALAVSLTRGKAVVNDEVGTFECRWLIEKRGRERRLRKPVGDLAHGVLQPERLATPRLKPSAVAPGG